MYAGVVVAVSLWRSCFTRWQADLSHQIVFLHQAAPPKPVPGEPCNGCGVCCAAQTCPVAKVFLRQLRGPCRALQWDAAAQFYRCGLLESPVSYLRWLPTWSEKRVRSVIRRWIAAGKGCDSGCELECESKYDSESATLPLDGSRTPTP